MEDKEGGSLDDIFLLGRQDLNPQSPPHKNGALPILLRPMGLRGIEPRT